MLGLAHRGFSLYDYRQHIVHTLRQVGYGSTLIGVQHVAPNAEVIGYDRVIPLEGRDAAHVTSAAVEFLDGAPREPFFLSVGFVETHREFRAPGPEEDARYCLPPHPLPDTPQTRQDMAAFKASARVLDEGIGAVLDALQVNGLADRTLVICTTDHGIAFPGMKCNLTDHGIGVMLILSGPFDGVHPEQGRGTQGEPGGFVRGRVCDALVSHIDLFPTVCDLLDVEPPPWLQGQSMMPLIRGEAEQINRQIFAEVTYHAAYEPQRAVRTPRWKYIRRFDERQSPVLPNCDDSLSKDVWLQHGWRDRPPALEQLYDLVFDRNETHNLAADPSIAEVLDEMRSRLDRWMRATNDPLLRGPVSAPGGARVNDPDSLSPGEPTTVIPPTEP
jgi:arylsulfatase A-like enzyme